MHLDIVSLDRSKWSIIGSMTRLPKQDTELLEAALIGFQHKKTQIEQKIAELRSHVDGVPSTGQVPAVKKHTLSSAARRRIAIAQKKRWAAVKAGQVKDPAPKAKKRVLSAAGRARIIAATKKRWAAFRKAQGAA
jgi:hypothetical protein